MILEAIELQKFKRMEFITTLMRREHTGDSVQTRKLETFCQYK
jgi:hypothetical protein